MVGLLVLYARVLYLLLGVGSQEYPEGLADQLVLHHFHDEAIVEMLPPDQVPQCTKH